MKILEIAVVGEYPISPPQFPHKRMAVLQVHGPLGRLAYVRNDITALDGVTANQFCDRRFGRWQVVHEMPQATILEEGNAPPIHMIGRAAAALRETAEAERRVCRRIAIHAEKLAHALRSLKSLLLARF